MGTHCVIRLFAVFVKPVFNLPYIVLAPGHELLQLILETVLISLRMEWLNSDCWCMHPAWNNCFKNAL